MRERYIKMIRRRSRHIRSKRGWRQAGGGSRDAAAAAAEGGSLRGGRKNSSPSASYFFSFAPPRARPKLLSIAHFFIRHQRPTPLLALHPWCSHVPQMTNEWWDRPCTPRARRGVTLFFHHHTREAAAVIDVTNSRAAIISAVIRAQKLMQADPKTSLVQKI